MKRLLLSITALTFAIALTACSASDQGKQAKEKSTQTAAKKADLKGPMVKFYMDLTSKINNNDGDLNAYESAESPATDMKAKASASAAAVAAELQKIKVPSELAKQKSDIEAALKDLATSYQTKADELKKDTPSLDAANAAFSQGDEKLGNVFVSVKMLKPSLAKEVN